MAVKNPLTSSGDSLRIPLEIEPRRTHASIDNDYSFGDSDHCHQWICEHIVVRKPDQFSRGPADGPHDISWTPRPASFGTASFVLNDAMTEMTFTATIFNIDFTGSRTPDTNDNLTLAHIHAGPLVMPGVNGSVVWGFFGMPFNDNMPNDIVNTPFTTGVGGTISGKWMRRKEMPARISPRSCRIFSEVTRTLISTQPNWQWRSSRCNCASSEPSTVVLLGLGIFAILVGLWRGRVTRAKSE